MSKVSFSRVCNVFNTLEGTDSRNEMTEILSNFYKELDSLDAQILSYLTLGRVAPLFVNSEFNYSRKSFISLLKDISKSKGLNEDIDKRMEELGDIGDMLQYFAEKIGSKSSGLALQEVYDLLWDIVNAKGTGSVESKNRIIVDTLNKLSSLEAKYFARIVCGDLRFGVNTKTLLDVFSVMVVGDKSLKDELDRAYGSHADIGYICSLISGVDEKEARKNLSLVKVQPGIPVIPRLVERVGGFEEVFDRLGDEFLVQAKYDGLRCQIHKFKEWKFSSKEAIWFKYIKKEENSSLFEIKKERSYIKLFTRNLEDVTEMFPEVVQAAEGIKIESFILDSEVLGWDKENRKFLSFQDTMQRRRKYEVTDLKKQIPVKAMVFDILYLNGKSLMAENTVDRIAKLEDINTNGGIEITETITVNNIDKLKEIFNKKIKKGHEGLIAKQKIGGYLPGVRNYEWIKLKKSMMEGLVDTIDLVAVGYNFGSGRRKSLGMGSVLGAIYDEKEDMFIGICNVGTGFSDEQLKNISKELKEDSLDEKAKNVIVEKALEPDVWVEPKVVFTVEADEISRSKGSKYPSLRFPRLIEWGRDKGPVEATSVEELEKMHRESREKA
jgi:DNA ligase-1